MKNNIYNTAKFLIGWPLSLGALYFIWNMVSPQSGMILKNLSTLNFTYLITGFICFFVFYFLRSFIWYKIISEESDKITFKQSSYLWALSEIKRYIPGKFWYILGRTLAFSDYGIKKTVTGRLMIVELEFFALGASIISLLSIPFLYKYFNPGFEQPVILTIIILISIFIVSLLYIFNQYLIRKFPDKMYKILHTILPEMTPLKLTQLLFISMIALLFYGIANYFVILSITYLNPQLIFQLAGFFTLSFLIGFLSILTPAGLGIREGATTLGLAKIIPYGIAAFSSLFARVILIISELLFILFTFFWIKIKNKKILRIENWIGSHPQESILVCLFLLYVIYFTITSFLRYDNFYTGRFDLGNMAQTVWNTAHGRIFILTDPNGTEIQSRLAIHSDFFLILLAPFYYIWENPKMLLLIQTIIVGAGAFFVYLLARDYLKNKYLALTFAFAYLINPAIQRANLYDFHSVTLVTFFLLGAYYFCKNKSYKWFLIFAFLAAITKEEIWAVTAIFGIYIYLFHKKKILGSSIFAISVLMFYYIIWHGIPGALGSGHFALSYFSEFGATPLEIIKTTIFSPQKIILTIFDGERLNYLNQLFLPAGYLVLLSPLYLIFAAPDLMINLLSNNVQLHQIYYQYTAPINPFIFISAIMGARILLKKFQISPVLITVYLLTISIIGAYLWGPMPGAIGSNLDMYTKQLKNSKQISEYLNTIPIQYSVSATNNIGSNLSHRERIYTVPNNLEKADFIIFLLTNPYAVENEKAMIEKLKKNKNYSIDYMSENFIVFKNKNIL